MIGIAALLVLFILPMLFAFGSGENAAGLFRASMGAVILVPVLAYAGMLVFRYLKQRNPQQPKSDIRNIIFDVGKVLVEFDWQGYLKGFGFSPEKYQRIAEATFCSEYWDQRDTGLLKEEEYVEKMVALAPEYEADIRMVMERTPETIEVFEYSETWVKYLKSQGYHLYILSNFSEYMLNRLREKMTFLNYMDGEIFSCNVGLIKPDLEIYRTLLKEYHLNAEQCVFLDDRAENCQGAGRVGIRTIQFQNFRQAARELEKLGIK